MREGVIDLVLPLSLARQVAARLGPGERAAAHDSRCIVTIPVALPLRGGRRSIAAGVRQSADPDPVLIAALRKAHAMVERDRAGRSLVSAAPTSPYERRVLRLAFLAPDIQRAILAGLQPRSLNVERLIHSDLPVAWPAQREALGFQTV